MMASEASRKFWASSGNCHFGPTKIVTPYFSVYNFMTPYFSCHKIMTPSIFGTPHSEENDSPLNIQGEYKK